MCSVKFVTIAPLIGLVQSVVWIGLSLLAVLVYLCVVPVSPYVNSKDFYRVTFVKLYFEGPRRMLDGSYLGQFNDDYRNPKKVSLLTPDLIFGIMIAYFILHVFYFILSSLFLLRRKVKSKPDFDELRKTCMGWGCLTLVISLLDVFLAAELVLDIFNLMKYMDVNDNEETEQIISGIANKISGITYIPLILALISSRFIGVWIWNVIVGGICFINTLCLKKVVGVPEIQEKKEKKEEVKNKEEEEEKPEPVKPTPPDWQRYRYSLEGFTNYKDNFEKVTPFRETVYSNYRPQQEPSSYSIPPLKFGKENDDWASVNDGYLHDEKNSIPAEEAGDFNHNLKNFEQGRKRIKIAKSTIGKPVSIPIPPPLPNNECYNC